MQEETAGYWLGQVFAVELDQRESLNALFRVAQNLSRLELCCRNRMMAGNDTSRGNG